MYVYVFQTSYHLGEWMYSLRMASLARFASRLLDGVCVSGTDWRVCRYVHLSDMVDHLFPPCQPSCDDNASTHASCLPGASDYSSFTYWRNPLADIGDELAEFVNSRDADKTVDVKKQAAAGARKAAASSPTASTTAKITDHKPSPK